MKWGENWGSGGWSGVGKLRHGEFAPLLSTRASLELQRDPLDPSLSQEMGKEPVLGGPHLQWDQRGRIPKKRCQGTVSAKGILGEGGAGRWHGEADAISEVPVPRGNGGQADVTVTEPFK